MSFVKIRAVILYAVFNIGPVFFSMMNDLLYAQRRTFIRTKIPIIGKFRLLFKQLPSNIQVAAQWFQYVLPRPCRFRSSYHYGFSSTSCPHYVWYQSVLSPISAPDYISGTDCSQ